MCCVSGSGDTVAMHVHIGGESIECFVEVVHLNHYAEANH